MGNIKRKSPQKPCIWIHAVSVGEVNATKTLISLFEKELPGYEIVLSATTDTGIARAKTLYDDQLSVFYFPFDISFVMNKAFNNITPNICLLMELEVWPNLAQIAKNRDIPLVVVNGRLSDKSFPRYKMIKKLVKPMFSKLTMALAQTEEYASRFKALGCPPDRVIVTNSLKYDTAQITDSIEGADKLEKQLNLCKQRLWVAGGTGPGEEEIILEVFGKLKKDDQFKDLRLAIIPRKPERFDEVAAMIEQSEFDFTRFSQLKNSDITLTHPPAVILGDTMGDLRKFYNLAKIVFVGRTLTPMGGSDMMEPTALGKCTIFGPHTFNFKQTVSALLANDGAIEIQDQNQLLEAMRKCLNNDVFSQKIAINGQNVIKQNQGATQKTVNAIKTILGK